MKYKVSFPKVANNLFKILMLTPVLFFNSIFPVSAQLTMIQEGAVWSMLHASQQTDEVWTHHYKFVDGYEINGQVFHRLYYTNNEDLSDWMPTNMHARQDGYLVFWEYNSYSLLSYDFGLEEGELFDFGIDPFMGTLLEIYAGSIDSIQLLNGEIRKRIKMNDDGGFSDRYWIEGIGTTQGELLRPYTGNDKLLCYRQGEELLYMEETYSNCHVFTNTSDPYQAHIAWNIHPNPTSDKITLQFAGEGLSNSEQVVSIYNYLGQLVFKKEKTNHEIDVSFLSAGIYTVIVSTEQGFLQPKLFTKIP